MEIRRGYGHGNIRCSSGLNQNHVVKFKKQKREKEIKNYMHYTKSPKIAEIERIKTKYNILVS